MSTLAALRAALRKRVGNPTATDVPDADLTAVLNSAYSDLSLRYKFHKVRKICTFDTVVDQARYGIPTDCFAVLRVRDNTNNRKLEKVGDRNYSERTDDTSGKPLKYLRQRDWVTLMPPPDGVYQIELFYKAKPADLAADVDVPVLPDGWSEGLIRLARFYYFDSIGDLPKARLSQAMYDSWVAVTPLEFDDEAEVIDSGVELPTLGTSQDPRLDFDHSP